MKSLHRVNGSQQRLEKTSITFAIIASLGYLINFGFGNLIVLLYGLYALHKFWLKFVIYRFQNNTWPKFQNAYKRLITWTLTGKRSALILGSTIALLFVSFFITAIRKPGVIFFPSADPNFTYVYMTLPEGTSAKHTDSIVQIAEKKVFKILNKKENQALVESVISNVAVGATDPNDGDRSTKSNKGKITVAFVEFSKRQGGSTRRVLEEIRDGLQGFAGVELTVEQERNGPPVGKAINIEIRGDDFDELVSAGKGLKTFLDAKSIAGVEELKSDFISSKPELILKVDRERANRFGISTSQIGMALRNSIYGAEASKFKDENDDYPIMVRLDKSTVNNVNELLNMRITFRDMIAGGMLRQIPLSSVASVDYNNTYGGINRLNQKRVITLASNVLPGFAPK